MPPTEPDICRAVMALVDASERRQTPGTLVAAVQKTHGVSPHRIRTAIKTLLKDQDLIYTYEMGCSFLIKNTLVPWQPVPGLWIAPPGTADPRTPSLKETVIRMNAGAAFGCEGHPTTRLCLQALVETFRSKMRTITGRALDIGTGSGILALAAAKLGYPSVLALDMDPCARHEARLNIGLNHLQASIQVEDHAFTQLGERFGLIMANLRYPTLKELAPWAKDHLLSDGVLAVSGYLTEEGTRLEALFRASGLEQIWARSEKRWAAGCFGFKGV